MTKTIRKMSPRLFDYDNRIEKLGKASCPLDRLDARIDWEIFRPDLEAIFAKPAKGHGGRPRHDIVIMFKILVLQCYYNN